MATDTNENEPSTPAGTPGGGEGVVLVVDDEAIMRKIAVNILKTEGYNVISATGGEEAIAIFKQRFHEIELVLLDLLMPDLSGQEVYEELKKIKPGTNVLLVSGSKMDKRIEELIKRGVKGFIEKPYAFDFLIQKVAELIGPVD